MKGSTGIGVWAAAASGSLFLHAAAVLALVSWPGATDAKAPQTVVTFRSMVPSAAVTAVEPVAATPIHRDRDDVGPSAVTDLAAPVPMEPLQSPTGRGTERTLALAPMEEGIVNGEASRDAVPPPLTLSDSDREMGRVRVLQPEAAIEASPQLSMTVPALPDPALSAAATGLSAAAAERAPSAVDAPATAPGIPEASSGPVASVPLSPTLAPPATGIDGPSVLVPSAPVLRGEPQARDGEERLALVARPAPPTPARPETLEEAYAKLLDLIAAEREGPGCFLPLPRRRADGIGVDGFAEDGARLARFEREIDQRIETPVLMRRHLVSQAQCAALAFAGEVTGAADDLLPIGLSASSIESGREIEGAVDDVRRRWFYLLVVDDEGRVQEVAEERLFLGGKGKVGFRTPLTLTGGPVATIQILIAIASDVELEQVKLADGDQAQPYFARLREEIAERGGGIAFGIAPLTVR